MSYIGGPLPGQEPKEEEGDDLREMWKEKRIGTKTVDELEEVGGKIWDATSEKWIKKPLAVAGHLLRDTLVDATTLEGSEYYNPGDLLTYGAFKGLEGVAYASKKLIGDPVKYLAHQGLGLDERIASGAGLAAEIAVPVGAAKLAKVAKASIVDKAKALVSMGGTGQGTATIGSRGLLSDAVDSALPRIRKGSVEYTTLLREAQKYAQPGIESGLKTPLKGFGKRWVDADSGRVLQFGAQKSSKTGVTKISPQDILGRKERGLRRSAGAKLDEQTLLKQFGGDTQLLENYKKTSRSIYRNLNAEVKKINIAGRAKHGANWVDLQVEHIYDVQFYWKLRNEVPNFPGMGANEAKNLMILDQQTNALTGAKASTLSGSDALIQEGIKKSKFPNYTKVVDDFLDFDMYNTVQNMKTSDWEGLTQLLIENPNMTAHDIIVNYF